MSLLQVMLHFKIPQYLDFALIAKGYKYCAQGHFVDLFACIIQNPMA